jgi:pyruvate,water dikinase
MPFFQELAKRMNLTYAELIEMKYKEIEELLQNGRQTSFSFKKELAMRYRDSALVLEHGKVSLLIGKELKQYYGREKRQLNYGLDIRELRGQPASPGRAEGRVSIVHSVNEIGKVKRGEVLVTSATTPMHLPAMEKSVAIVTDEGGLLSHAAIVSRELKIPCVVGTKIATRVFKDGDLVEVDAEKGIVRKLV